MFVVCLAIVGFSYIAHFFMGGDHQSFAGRFTGAVFELMNAMSWGIVMGIAALGILSRVPREFMMSALGSHKGFQGILRATLAGTVLDLCSHGILMVAAKLYERGATLGQVMAFLIASPWNSLSLTFILISLIGLKWTLTFIFLSFVVGVISGVIFDRLVAKGVLPANPNHMPVEAGFAFWPEAKRRIKTVSWTPAFFLGTLKAGALESRMILRWMLLGVIITGVLRTVMDPAVFQQFFGPTVIGLGITLVAATIIEVCSEGAAPIASDILTRAGAVGNSFTFLMAGVATDYTEIMVMRETTKSWKVALFLPLVTVPQVLVLGYILNQFGAAP